MSILGTIFSRILPHAHASEAPAASTAAASPAASQPARPAAPTQAATAQPASAQSASTQPAAPQPQAQGMQPQQAAAGAGAGAATMERVDVEQVLDGLAAHNPNKLNWRSSIVDLMKLVGMDSTLQERKELADELGYRGDKNDSAAMNVWLHKEVMRKLEENGGKVPENLKH